MSKNYILLALFLLINITCSVQRQCFVNLKQKWHVFEQPRYLRPPVQEKWVLINSASFIKKSKEPLSLKSLTFRWTGDKLDSVVGSLYKKNLSKKFLPLQENFVSDAFWDKKKQTLLFNFPEITLNPKTVFYLIITIPQEQEETMRQATFVVDQSCLPEEFKKQQ